MSAFVAWRSDLHPKADVAVRGPRPPVEVAEHIRLEVLAGEAIPARGLMPVVATKHQAAFNDVDATVLP